MSIQERLSGEILEDSPKLLFLEQVQTPPSPIFMGSGYHRCPAQVPLPASAPIPAAEC